MSGRRARRARRPASSPLRPPSWRSRARRAWLPVQPCRASNSSYRETASRGSCRRRRRGTSSRSCQPSFPWSADMARLAFALPHNLESVLVDDARDHGHDVVARCASAGELASMLDPSSAEFVVVSSAERYLTARLLTEADRAGVRVVAINDTDAGRRNAITVGLHEVVDGGEAWAGIEAALLANPLRASAPTGVGDGSGRVIAVWGPAGSPGRTSLAINIAAELASAGHSVALADVDTYSGFVAPTLGLLDEAPGFAAACRLAGTGSLTQLELERIAQRYVSSHGSFWVLTGIGRPSRWPELSASRVAGALDLCREWVD